MRIVCPGCKSNNIVNKRDISGKEHMKCQNCGKMFIKILPVVEHPIKPEKEIVTQSIPERHSDITVNEPAPIRGTPGGWHRSGPVSVEYLRQIGIPI